VYIDYEGLRLRNNVVQEFAARLEIWCSQAIPAFEEAVAGMRAGGVRRLELAGERPELGWDRDRSNRRAALVPCQRLSANGNALPLLLSKQFCLAYTCTSVIGLGHTQCNHVLLSLVCGTHLSHTRMR
jgi:hypothetical protein